MIMKKIIVTLTVFAFFLVKSMGQTPIIDLQDRDGTRIQNAYYKDTHNILNSFVGTWLYTNGNTSMKIVLVKKTMLYNDEYYEDILYGEYRYVENGIEKLNSLHNLAGPFINENNYKIFGNHTPGSLPTPFDEYTPGETRVSLGFEDNIGGTIDIRKTLVGGQEAIQIWKVGKQYGIIYPMVSSMPIFPDGVYTLIKQ